MQLQYTTNFSNAKTQNRTKSPCFFPLKGLKTPTKAPISDALPLPNAHECVPKNHHLFVSWRAFWCKTACLDAENGVYRPFLSNLGKPFSRQSERKAVSLSCITILPPKCSRSEARPRVWSWNRSFVPRVCWIPSSRCDPA